MKRVAALAGLALLVAAGPAMADPQPPDASQAVAPAPAADASSPPTAPDDHAADRFYDPAAMAAARAALREEHGGEPYPLVTVNLAEYQAGQAGGGYRWDAEASFGGDIDRLVIKSEGDGSRRDGLDAAEIQGLYSHAVGPYFDAQAGLRQDFGPGAPTYVTAGIQGLLPYWIEVEAAAFLSTRGELLGRAEATYDLRLTQRWVLQPRVELNFAARDSPETRIGSGLSNAELGLRLHYEISRQFAPYVGVSYDRRLGRTADFARLHDEDGGGASVVAGVRTWF